MTLSVASVLYGETGSTYGSTLSVTLDDGTVYSDLHSSSNGIGTVAETMVSYTTDVPAALTVDAVGDLTLLGNHHSLVTVTATTACSPTVATTDSAANLAVPFRGVDLGANDGLQFSESGAVVVPVLVNAGSAKLVSFQVVVSFDSTYLPQSYSRASRAARSPPPPSAGRR